MMRGITQTQCVNDTGVQRNTISKMCNGHILGFNAAVADRLCKYLRCTISDIWEYVPDDDEMSK